MYCKVKPLQKNMTYLFAAILMLMSCQQNSENKDSISIKNTHIAKKIDPVNLQKNYAQLKTYISSQRQVLSTSRMNEEAKQKKASSFISTVLIDSIIPYWIGTRWDFNGISPEPRKGEIACGYFVSTTLLHAGFKLNRYKTAQKASSEIVKQLCTPSSIKNLGSMDKLNMYLEDVKDNEILIIGLDFHVGFIFKKDNTAYFAHSNYIDREGVIIEPLTTSMAIIASKAYYIGNVTTNKSLVSKWLLLQ